MTMYRLFFTASALCLALIMTSPKPVCAVDVPVGNDFSQLVNLASGTLTTLAKTKLSQPGAQDLFANVSARMAEAAAAASKSPPKAASFKWSGSNGNTSTLLEYEWVPTKPGAKTGSLSVSATYNNQDGHRSGQVFFRIPVTQKGGKYQLGKPGKIVAHTQQGEGGILSTTGQYSPDGTPRKTPGTLYAPLSIPEALCTDGGPGEAMLNHLQTRFDEMVKIKLPGTLGKRDTNPEAKKLLSDIFNDPKSKGNDPSILIPYIAARLLDEEGRPVSGGGTKSKAEEPDPMKRYAHALGDLLSEVDDRKKDVESARQQKEDAKAACASSDYLPYYLKWESSRLVLGADYRIFADYKYDVQPKTVADDLSGAFHPKPKSSLPSLKLTQAFKTTLGISDPAPATKTQDWSSISPRISLTYDLSSSPYFGLSPKVRDIFIMIDNGASMSEVGRRIGLRNKGIGQSLLPPWANAAYETAYLLDEWDIDYELTGLEIGIAVAESVRAAGGSEADALRMGSNAIAWAGGTPAEQRKLMSGNYRDPSFGFGSKIRINLDHLFESDAASMGIKKGFIPPTVMLESFPIDYKALSMRFAFGSPSISKAGLAGSSTTGTRISTPSESKPKPATSTSRPPMFSTTTKLKSKLNFADLIAKNQGRYGDGTAFGSYDWGQAGSYLGGGLSSGRLCLDDDLGKWAGTGGSCTKLKTAQDFSWLSKLPSPIGYSFGEKNYTRDVQTKVVPNDPLFQPQKEENNTGEKVLKKGLGFALGALTGGTIQSNDDDEVTWQWYMPEIGMTPMGKDSVWDTFDANKPNTVVAVIDSGLDLKHPDRPSHLWRNTGEIPGNKKDDDNNGYVDDIHGWNFLNETADVQDDYGHGTFVAGIIAAATNNGKGIAGINPGAQIMSLKVTGRDRLATSLSIYRAIRYAVDNGAAVINISLGRNAVSKLEQIGINYAWSMGCLVVVSSGNQGGMVAEYGPPGVPRSFSVGATDEDDEKRGTSNIGRTVVMVAPGENIYSLSSSTGKRDGRIMPAGDSEYHTLSGTSFSSPMVAAIASLKWAQQPELTNRQLANLLMSTARDVQKKGWDVRTGAGILDGRAVMKTDGTRAVGVRITDLVIGRNKRKKILWMDLYGVISGPVKSYTVYAAKGRKPDKKDFKKVLGPTSREVDNNILCRLSTDTFGKRGWTFRIDAKLPNGKTRSVTMGFDKEGKVYK